VPLVGCACLSARDVDHDGGRDWLVAPFTDLSTVTGLRSLVSKVVLGVVTFVVGVVLAIRSLHVLAGLGWFQCKHARLCLTLRPPTSR